MGNIPLTSIPGQVTCDEFEQFVLKECPKYLKPQHLDCKSIFGGLCTPDGYMTRDMILEFSRATDVYLSHEWGYDEEGRSVHDRVRFVNKHCKKLVLLHILMKIKKKSMVQK